MRGDQVAGDTAGGKMNMSGRLQWTGSRGLVPCSPPLHHGALSEASGLMTRTAVAVTPVLKTFTPIRQKSIAFPQLFAVFHR